jgi:hypothetical protein
LVHKIRRKAVEKSVKNCGVQHPLWLAMGCYFFEQQNMRKAFAPGAPEGRAGR